MAKKLSLGSCSKLVGCNDENRDPDSVSLVTLSIFGFPAPNDHLDESSISVAPQCLPHRRSHYAGDSVLNCRGFAGSQCDLN